LYSYALLEIYFNSHIFIDLSWKLTELKMTTQKLWSESDHFSYFFCQKNIWDLLKNSWKSGPEIFFYILVWLCVVILGYLRTHSDESFQKAEM
jgi:hypothetical protein